MRTGSTPTEASSRRIRAVSMVFPAPRYGDQEPARQAWPHGMSARSGAAAGPPWPRQRGKRCPAAATASASGQPQALTAFRCGGRTIRHEFFQEGSRTSDRTATCARHVHEEDARVTAGLHGHKGGRLPFSMGTLWRSSTQESRLT